MCTILIVDDERTEREGLRYLIEKSGHTLNILEAANGEDALDVIENTHIDILLTDIRMPIMSGLQLSKRVRETDVDMKIIFSTAYDEFEYARQAIEAGASGYLLKPVMEDQFYREFEKVMSQIHLERERVQDLLTGRFWYELEHGIAPDDETLLTKLDELRMEISAQIHKDDLIQANANIEMFISCLRALTKGSMIYTRYHAVEVLSAMLKSRTPQKRREVMEEITKATDTQALAQIVEKHQTELLSAERIGKDDEDAVEKILHTIETHYSEPLTLESLAKSVYLAPSYVSYLFKRKTGTTLIKYITSYRIKKAAEMLKMGTASITSIAQSVGYDNSSYFSSVFRAQYKMSPADYRRSLRKE